MKRRMLSFAERPAAGADVPVAPLMAGAAPLEVAEGILKDLRKKSAEGHKLVHPRVNQSIAL